MKDDVAELMLEGGAGPQDCLCGRPFRCEASGTGPSMLTGPNEDLGRGLTDPFPFWKTLPRSAL
jgi:hypothetical protein